MYGTSPEMLKRMYVVGSLKNQDEGFVLVPPPPGPRGEKRPGAAGTTHRRGWIVMARRWFAGSRHG